MLQLSRGCSSLVTRFGKTVVVHQGRKMSSEVVGRLDSRAKQADEAILWLKKQIASLQSSAQSAELETLQEENKQLKAEVERWTKALVQAEEKNGVKQVPLPNRGAAPTAPVNSTAAPAVAAPVKTAPADTKPAKEVKADKKAEKKAKPAKPAKSDAKAAGGAGDAEPVDIGLLDMRVGRIVTAEKHPDADSLYVEQVDVGEAAPRTVVSGLVRFIPVEEMQNRMAVLLCNLKPAKMRGVTSQAMVMCASTPDKVEILSPPAGAQPGDFVTIEGFVRRADAQLNPKKKIFEQVAPELKTDGEKRATYRGVVWEVAGKGVVTAQTLTNVNIK